LLGVSLDITKQKRVEADLRAAKVEAEAVNQIKSEFIANMSHDIRTPLSGIIGMAEALRREPAPEKREEYGSLLVNAGHQLLDLLNEIIEITQIESGNLDKNYHDFNLKKTFEKIIDLVKPSLIQKKLDLKFEFDDTLPLYIIADEVRLHRIVLNLVGNAIKFTNEGYIRIAAKNAGEEDQKINLVIVVEDTGVGVPKDKQKHIFDRFHRLTTSYQGGYQGSGLGLTIVKQLVEDLGGKLDLQSTLGKGSSFTCIIPIIKVKQQPSNSKNPDQTQRKAIKAEDQSEYVKRVLSEQSKPLRVLLVEDNKIAQVVARSVLEEFKVDVDVVSNAEQAINQFKANAYDLVFLDIGLPDKDGYEVAQTFRKQEKGTSKTAHIIACTAHIDSKNEQKCYDCGIDQVMQKPITMLSCCNIVLNYLQHA